MRFLPLVVALAAASCSPVGVTDSQDAAGSGGEVASSSNQAGVDGGAVDSGAIPEADAGPRCPVLPPADDPLEVRTLNATVKGALRDDGVSVWKGIRYGAPPVGDLRFRPTQPAACEPALVEALEDPPQCPQLGASVDAVVGSEDCLFLNVFRPERQEGEDRALLPVLFFIHGGAEIFGSGHQPAGTGNLYDGAKLATEAKALVVTINYRLGALGFLAHPSLAKNGVLGNWAHHDVIEALKWTRDNIAGFGGDPSHVTVFGESAGAHNVCVLLASPLAAGLFSSAIMESGGCEVAPRDAREAEGQDTANALGCDQQSPAEVAACLRTKTPEQFIRLTPPIPPLLHVWWLPYGSTVDGDVLQDQPLNVIRSGQHNQVPFIAGSNREETNLFLAADGALTCLDLRLQLELLLDSSFSDANERNAAVESALAQYACNETLVVRDVLVEASTDLEFTCQARRVARAMAASQPQPVWRYHFEDRANYGTFLAMGAFHAWELFYVFDAFSTGLYVPSSAERDLAKLVQRMWGRMARNGNPNGGDDVMWPAYPGTMDNVLVLDEDPFGGLGGALDVHAAPDPAPQCDFWDRYAY